MVSGPAIVVLVVVLSVLAVTAYAIVQLYRENQETVRQDRRLKHKKRILREQRDHDALMEFADADEATIDRELEREGIDPDAIDPGFDR